MYPILFSAWGRRRNLFQPTSVAVYSWRGVLVKVCLIVKFFPIVVLDLQLYVFFFISAKRFLVYSCAGCASAWSTADNSWFKFLESIIVVNARKAVAVVAAAGASSLKADTLSFFTNLQIDDFVSIDDRNLTLLPFSSAEVGVDPACDLFSMDMGASHRFYRNAVLHLATVKAISDFNLLSPSVRFCFLVYNRF